MENARIFLVEDDENWINLLVKMLPINGHKVVLMAHTLREALEKIDCGMLDKSKVDVAIVDDRIPRRKRVIGVDMVNAGYLISEAIGRADRSIKIIAHTVKPPTEANYGHFYAYKGSVRYMSDAIKSF